MEIKDIDKAIASHEAELQREIPAALDRIGKIIGSPVGAIHAKMTCWRLGTPGGDYYVPYPSGVDRLISRPAATGG